MRYVYSVLLVVLFLVPQAFAGYGFKREMQAPVDESFYGIDDPRNEYFPFDPSKYSSDAIPKRNGGYLWGYSEAGDKIFYGVMNNAWGGWLSTYVKADWMTKIAGYKTATQVYTKNDFMTRPAQIYAYNTKTKQLNAINPATQPAGYQDALNQIFMNTGYRAGGYFDNLAFLGGITIVKPIGESKVTLFAFNPDTEKYVGHVFLPYDNIKRIKGFTHPDGSKALYLFLGPDNTGGQSGNSPCAVLRWVGTAASPFTGGDAATPGFVQVADLGDWGSPAEYDLIKISDTDYRFVTGVWSVKGRTNGKPDTKAAMLISNSMPAAGFTAANKAIFTPFFKWEDFEPDVALGAASEIGAMAVYGKYLYWGTMHTALAKSGFEAYQNLYQSTSPFYATLFGDDDAVRNTMEKTFRSGMVFRTDFTNPANPQTEMLYGQNKFYAFDETLNSGAGDWVLKENGYQLQPKYGPMGFGSLLNLYIWTMQIYENKLYIGTFDISGGVEDYVNNFDPNATIGTNYPHLLTSIAKNHGGYEWGGDLYVFEDTNSSAKPVTTNGFNNPFNNGIRSSHVVNNKVYFGTSTWSNLGDKGGYELYEVYEDGPRITESTIFTTSPKCFNGGLRINVATDLNNNGKIDPNEPIISTEEICNGVNGDKGSSGCSAGNGTDAGLAALFLLSIVALPIMLRRKN